jgi:hypothetical protein
MQNRAVSPWQQVQAIGALLQMALLLAAPATVTIVSSSIVQGQLACQGLPLLFSVLPFVARTSRACFCSVCVTLCSPSAQLQAAIRAQLNPLFKVSRVVVKDALPRTASNKLMRRVLRAEAMPEGVAAASKL